MSTPHIAKQVMEGVVAPGRFSPSTLIPYQRGRAVPSQCENKRTRHFEWPRWVYRNNGQPGSVSKDKSKSSSSSRSRRKRQKKKYTHLEQRKVSTSIRRSDPSKAGWDRQLLRSASWGNHELLASGSNLEFDNRDGKLVGSRVQD